MATSTTNLGLIKPGGSDKIRIAQINQNMDILDTKIGAVGQTSLQAQVTALNTRTTTYNIGSVASLSSLKSSLLTYAQSLTARDVRAVSLYASSAIGSGFVSGQTYQGMLHIASKTNDVLTFSITFESSNDQPPIWVNYKNGTWTVEQLAINSDVTALNSKIETIEDTPILGTKYITEPLTDMNNARMTGVYAYYESTANIPVTNMPGMVFVISQNNPNAYGSMWVYQIAFTTAGDNKMYLRYQINGGTWGNWREV